nr:MAG TPA: hypothetical protein [Caudoviricetes sp.]
MDKSSSIRFPGSSRNIAKIRNPVTSSIRLPPHNPTT